MSFDYGGGVAVVSKSSLAIVGGSFFGNITVGEGGGVYTGVERSVNINGTEFIANRVGETLPSVEVPGEIVEGEGGGGGTFIGGSDPANVINALFAEKHAHGDGGGILIENHGTVEISDTIVRDNESDSGGGGIENAGMRTTLTRLTIHGNKAFEDGGGIQGNGSGDFTNTIVAGNLLSPNCNFALGSHGGNLEDGDSCHFRGSHDRVNASSVGLDAVADNGGPVLTMTLQPDSLAVDGGVNPCSATDARGVSRPQNGLCDIGGFEFEGPFPRLIRHRQTQSIFPGQSRTLKQPRSSLSRAAMTPPPPKICYSNVGCLRPT